MANALKKNGWNLKSIIKNQICIFIFSVGLINDIVTHFKIFLQPIQKIIDVVKKLIKTNKVNRNSL